VALPVWTFDSTMIFPADRSLRRPEAGVALPDGRLIVTDQEYGLRMVEPDGRSGPFGNMLEAGYSHRPPSHSGGANGVSLEPDGKHLLVADIFGGGIYRVEVATGATERVYQHRYGVNTVLRDSHGEMWFTQSTHNTPEEGEGRMWQAVDRGAFEGALYRLATVDGADRQAELMLDSLGFGNGLAIDEANGHLYVAETMAGRVLRFDVDLETGRLSDRTVFVDSIGADNLELDGIGHLWVADPFMNRVVAVNTATGARQVVFHHQSPAQLAIAAEFTRRGLAGEPRMDLFTPALWEPLPGIVTGIIVGPSGPVYLTGLGGALVKLPR
jgi:sugar lactone lactonase YvrE